MSDDTGVIDKGWDALPSYEEKSGEGEDAVTVSISTAPGEWLVNTNDSVVVPMSMLEVVEALRARKLDERSLVWRAGMQEWAPVDKVPQLKLAARLPSVLPPPKAPPVRAASPAPSPPMPRVAPVPTRAGRNTLPFGSAPRSAPSNPFQSRPTPRPTLAPPPSADEGEVLAVYERPAATISFELEPEAAPRRTPAPAPLETLAPMTTDSARSPTLAPLPRGEDRSALSAQDFRSGRYSSKRLVVLSSIGSAAAASLLTWWLSSTGTDARSQAAEPAPVELEVPASTPVAPATGTTPTAEPPPVAEAAPSSTTPPKPKAKRKARPWKPPVAARPASPDAAESASPAAVPNPFEIRLEEEDPAKTKPQGTNVEPSDEAPATSEPTSPEP